MKSWMIIDGQWGSTGKGLLAGYLARRHTTTSVVGCYGPNAGHTYVFDDGAKVMTRMLPIGGVVGPEVKSIFMGPGSIIDPGTMMEELEMFADLLKGKRIYIHPRAAVVLPRHKEIERAVLGGISSTQKGTGAAQADKVMRAPDVVAEVALANSPLKDYLVKDNREWLNLILSNGNCSLQIESAQGYELGVNAGSAYPYCTARDITPATVLNDCGLPHWWPAKICVVVRTFPIRVGHQYDSAGNKVGDSGPVHEDQKELTWEELGVELERTTVTNKVRRVFTFSDIGFRNMARFVRPDYVFLNFVNYLEDSPSWTTPETSKMVSKLNSALRHAGAGQVAWIGCGPKDSDVYSCIGYL